MAITSLANIGTFYPLPDVNSARSNGGLIGRWSSFVPVTGDASGGSVTVATSVGAPLGGNSHFYLFDLRFLGLWMSPVLSAASGGRIYVASSEWMGGVSPIWIVRVAITSTGGIQLDHASYLPKYKFACSKRSDIVGFVEMSVDNNTNLAGYNFTFGGYIYDERFIQAD